MPTSSGVNSSTMPDTSSTPPSSSGTPAMRRYETGPFSSNVTPPLTYQQVHGVLQSSTTPASPPGATTSSTRNGRPSIFAGLSRSAEPKEVPSDVPPPPPASTVEYANSLPLYSALRTAISPPSSSAFSLNKLRKDRSSKVVNVDAEQRADQSDLPAIPDELMVALSLPPGTTINARTLARAAPSTVGTTSAPSNPTRLPSFESFRPLDLKSDMPWTASWLSRERFTHDLSKRTKKNMKNIVSTLRKDSTAPAIASRNKASLQNTTQGEGAQPNDDEEEEELDQDLSSDEDDEEEESEITSEIASRLSFVDSMELPGNASMPELGKQATITQNHKDGQEIIKMKGFETSHGLSQRVINPLDMESGMAASLRRNRADSSVILPPRISTEIPAPSITLQSSTLGDTVAMVHPSSPPRLTPDTASTVYLDAFSSPLGGSMSPAQSGSAFSRLPPASPTVEDIAPRSRENSNDKPTTAITSNVSGPPSPVYTVRPRSMSESFLSSSTSIQGGGSAGVRASQPNKSIILNISLNGRKSIEEEEDCEGNDDIERQLGSAGSLLDRSRPVVASAGEENSQATSSSSSFDTGRNSPINLSGESADEESETGTNVEVEHYTERGVLLFITYHKQQISKRLNADYTVAMVGARQVGKSTIIAQNLKLSSDKCTLLYEDGDGNKVMSYSGCYSITGKPCTINVLEVDMDILKSTSEGLSWPAGIPRPEGVMICYKYGDPKGLEQLKTLLHGFWTRGGIHLIALATQCPAAQEGSTPYKAEGDKAAEICNIHGAGLVHLDGGIEDPNRKARNSLQWILRKILESRGQSSRSPSRMKKLVLPKRSTANLLPDKPNGQLFAGTSAPTTMQKDSEDMSKSIDETGHSMKTVSSASGHSGLTGDAILDEKFLLSKSGHNQTDIYLSRDDLVQKLLFAAVAGDDDEYISSFFIVFRRFETPYKLLNSWLARFNMGSQHHNDDPLLSRYVQMKLCNLLTRWLKFHPNDFCAAKTRDLLKIVLDKLYALTWVHHYAMEIEELAKNLDQLKDQDSAWTLPDQEDETPLHIQLTSESAEMLEKQGQVPSADSAISISSRGQSLNTSVESGTPATSSFSADVQELEHKGEKPAMIALEKIASTSSSGKRANDTSTSSAEMSPQSSNRSAQQGQKLTVVLEASNTFLECPVQQLAMQITKQAWDIFASMQPRDLLRYIMTPRDPKNPDARPQRNADNPVTKAVSFSNYLSNWTASLLLVQSRQRTRARVFEHLIRLALALRALDDLDCLSRSRYALLLPNLAESVSTVAILVGLNSTPVHRLHDLATSIPEVIYKKFRSMNFLMASTRSFAAYRLALTTARPEVIPYLGVHLQDVTRVHDSKSDMRDGLVNWSKMRQIGKYASAIAHCARLTPHYTHDERLSTLVTGVPVFSLDSDDDTLYELSYSYKPRQKRSGSNSQTAKFKRLFKEAISIPSLGPTNHSAPVST